MPIRLREVAIYLSMHAKNKLGDIAFAMNKKGEILSMARHDARPELFDDRSGIINLVQNYKAIEGDYSGLGEFIVSSVPPTERDLGMMAMTAHLPIVYFVQKPKIKPEFKTFHWGGKDNPTWELQEGFDNITQAKTIPPIDNSDAKLALDDKFGLEPIFQLIPPAGPGQILQVHDILKKIPTKEAKNLVDSFNPYLIKQIEPLTHLTYGDEPEFTLPQFKEPDFSGKNKLVDLIFMHLAWAIVHQRMINKKISIPGGHNIGSVLVDPQNRIISWGVNTNYKHSTLHGEINLVHNYFKDDNTIGVNIANSHKNRLYSTLEPCYMCAGMYSDSGNPNIDGPFCYYDQDDPGIKNNALERRNHKSGQDQFVTEIGIDVSEAFKEYVKPPKKSASADYIRKPLSGFLNNEAVKFINEATVEYLKLYKEEDFSEKIIWQNGLILLGNIGGESVYASCKKVLKIKFNTLIA
ncbi:MAG: hypothetical protein DHS20C18_29650 [Saprospiraceae bacterium]|nr:MAG: hypothetical protein DHS20C18_29650 [Saprospiraceae bacterium]